MTYDSCPGPTDFQFQPIFKNSRDLLLTFVTFV